MEVIPHLNMPFSSPFLHLSSLLSLPQRELAQFHSYKSHRRHYHALIRLNCWNLPRPLLLIYRLRSDSCSPKQLRYLSAARHPLSLCYYHRSYHRSYYNTSYHRHQRCAAFQTSLIVGHQFSCLNRRSGPSAALPSTPVRFVNIFLTSTTPHNP